MSTPTADIDHAVARFRRRLEEYAETHQLSHDRAVQIARQAVDFAAARELYRGEIAGRVGPVYNVEALAEYLTVKTMTSEAVRKRAKELRLVAFQTDDRHWLFPAWQFDSAGGQLVPNARVIALWQQLPHGGWMDAANLTVWMNTTMRGLGVTPVERARERGADDRALGEAVSRLRARSAGRAV